MADFSKAVFGTWNPQGTTLVEASAGTGKTYSIQSAYLRLVLEGYPVTGILVVTFTDAATAELRDRLRTVLDECRMELEMPTGKGRAWEALEGGRRRGATDGELERRIAAALALYDRAAIYSIHGFCNHVLTQYAFEAGHECDTELQQDTAGAVQDACRDWWRKNLYGTEAPPAAAAEGFAGLQAKVCLRLGHPDAGVDGGDGPVLDDVAALYERQRRERNELTFDAMLTDLRTALKGPTSERLKEAVRNDYRAALVDEFQDTDAIQYQIFRTLFADGNTPLLFVGDPKQAIYRFRGGDIYTYKEAKKNVPEPRRYDLGTNYRSEAPLLEAINAYFGERKDGDTFGDPAIPYKALESGAAERELATLEGLEGASFVLWTAEYKTKDEMLERACAVTADEIVRLLGAPSATLGGKRLKPQHFAVLMHSNQACETMLNVLRRRGVNAVCARESDLRKTAAAQGMRSILRSMAAPGDIPALRAALGVAFMPSTKADLEALARGESLEAVSEWSRKLWKAGACWEKDGFMRAWKILRDELGLQRRIMEMEDGEQLAADLEQVAEWLHLQEREKECGAQGLARAYEAWLANSGQDRPGEGASLIGGLPTGEVDGVPKGRAGDAKRKIADDSPAVKVMTIHKSKGLEFPVVFVPTLWTNGKQGKDEKTQPEQKKNEKAKGGQKKDEPEKKVFLVYHDADGKERLGNAPNACRAEEESEDIRQAYVALTRAMNRLYVVDARKSGGKETTVASLTDAWRARGAAGVIAEVPLPEAAGLRYAGTGEVGELRPARPMPKTDRGNGRTSFSSMTDGMHGGRSGSNGETETEAEDRDEADGGAGDAGETPAGGAVRTGIFALPPGTQTGSCIHELFERLDFGNAAEHGELIEQMLKRYGLEAHRGAVERMVEVVLGTELPDGGGKLRDAKTRMAEMKFDFPMRRTTAATLKGVADVLDAHWVGDDPWKREFSDKLRTAEGADRAIARGYMTGAIDLVFRAGGKFHLADWKTNRLKGTAESFGEAGLRAEMKACLYPLQYLVYLTALDGILRERLEGYEYDKDIGNVYYLFVRGMDGTGRGVYVDQPSRDTIEALGNYLRGGER